MLERRVIAVEGTVQGVGFRPYVHRLAAANALHGFVRNDAGGVHIDVEGELASIDEFCRTLAIAPPALATIAELRVATAPLRAYERFHIAASAAPLHERGSHSSVPPDVATCDDCLAELFDPDDRRFGHAFISCTNCGPRFTIVASAPYDRVRTTMAVFALCDRCRREYDDPMDRRFHAETTACPECGPRLVARDGSAAAAIGTHPHPHPHPHALAAAAAALHAGAIVAVKALGGFHLACDAANAGSVERLRERKHRPAKPFAVMVRDAAAADALGEFSSVERATLESSARPVVLVRRRAGTSVAAAVAPGSDSLGLMLPSTPLHHLLLAALDRPLVMTSGNRGGDPVVIDDAAAGAALGGIADLHLTHDRTIAARCDDSVVRVIAGEARPLRRARGYVPRAIALPFALREPVLAVGAHLKSTICVARGAAAYLSAHVGDLDSAAARGAMRATIDATLRMTGVHPLAIAHDLHPDYASTHVAHAVAAEHGVTQRIAVQHHHAHVAACVAEYGDRQPVIGVVFDGAGLGTDGAVWGGEFLAVDGARFHRLGHLGYVPLPGGDAAARRPWRAAAAHLAHARIPATQLAALCPPGIAMQERRLVQQLVSRAETPATSSIGRLFDAVASLLGLCHVASFEGQAATALEDAAADRVASEYPVSLTGDERWTADPAPIIAAVVADVLRGRDRAAIAAAFHGALRDLVVLGCERAREQTGLETVVLSGGVFMNRLLTESALAALVERRFRVLVPRQIPCNDGGLALGQAWVAACALEDESCA